MNRPPKTACPNLPNRPRSALQITGWVVAACVSVVVAVGVGCGTAWAERPGEGSSQADSSSSNTHQTEPSTGPPDSPHLRDTKPTTSPSRETGAASDGADEEDADSELGSVQSGGDRTAEAPGRRRSDNSVAGNSLRERKATAAKTTANDDPVGQTSPPLTGQPPDALSLPTKVGEFDEESPGKLETTAADRNPDPENASVKTAVATAPAQPAEALSSITAPTASSSGITGHHSSVVELTVTPETASAVKTLVNIAQREGDVNPLVTAAADAAAGLNAASPALYTGQPSIVQRVVVLVLRAVNAVLSPFGGILAFTGLKVPIFADGVPPSFVTAGLDVQHDSIAGMPVYILTPRTPTGATVVALHGGAYAAEASLFHWEMYADLARKTGATVIVPDYPLIGEPGGTADVVVPQTAELITKVIATRGAANTYVLGDSAGGGLALAAVQLLVASGAATPRRMVLLAPWLDATVSDPASSAIWDPLLNVKTLMRDGELWAGDLGPMHPWASPINGSLDGLPPITVYSGSLDLLSPQALRLRDRAIAEGADITFELRKGLMHDYPIFFFLPDALHERPSIYRALLGDDASA